MKSASNFVRVGTIACAALSAFVVTGCTMTAEDIPLPGGPDIGDHPNHISVRFADVLDLVPQSAVKIDGLPAGRVTEVRLAVDGWTAEVGIAVRSDIALPANSVASIQQTNLLGEKFIQLSAPTEEEPRGELTDGDVIGLDSTHTATDIEQVLGALSLLLNGGGVAQLQPIVAELKAATGGRESELNASLRSTEKLIGALDRQRDSITTALDGVNTLSSRANAQSEQIEAVLDELPAGIAVLNEQRPQFVEMLRAIDKLGDVGNDILLRSRDDLIADLRALRPLLQTLGESAEDLIPVLAHVPTYPFPDATVDGILGSSSNVFLNVDTQIANTLYNLGVGRPDPVYRAPFTSKTVLVDPGNPYINGNGYDPRTTIILPLLPTPPLNPAPDVAVAERARLNYAAPVMSPVEDDAPQAPKQGGDSTEEGEGGQR